MLSIRKILCVCILIMLVAGICPLPGIVSALDETKNKWLSLSDNTTGSRYIVDSAGQPFQLFGMARCQYHAHDEDLAYGGAAGVANHFKKLGCNAIRLAVSFNTNEYPDIDRIAECGGYNEMGIQNFITKYIDPDVQAIIKEGMYVILDLHMYPPYNDDPDVVVNYMNTNYIPFWEQVAKRYKDEPMIAVFELWNEPAYEGMPPLSDGKFPSGYDWAEKVRQFYINCANTVRQYDTQHILLLSDHNAGWGTSWPITWDGYEYAADPTCKKIIYSIHAATEQLETLYSYYNTWWADTASNNNICFHFGEVETEGDLMNTTAMQNLVDMLDQRKNTHHYSAFLWRPHDDTSNYVSVWTDFAKSYTSASDTSQWFFEAETSSDANFNILSNGNYFSTNDVYPGKAVQLKGSVGQWGYGTVTLSETFAPDTYEIRIRSYGDSESAAQQGLYYETTDGIQHLIAYINGRTDGKYYTDSYYISNTEGFNKLILKKTISSLSACNPVDRFIVLSDARVEAEDACPSTNIDVYNLSTASGGSTACIKGTCPIWAYASLTWEKYFSPDTYKLTVRLYGDPANAVQQGIYYIDTEGIHNPLGFINGRTDGSFYTVSYTFTTTVPFYEIAFKKSVTSSQGTNPIDFISIERQ